MKPYIFNYSETIPFTNKIAKIDATNIRDLATDTTSLTGNIESIDPDEISIDGQISAGFIYARNSSTWVTESVEPSDDDEIHLDSTIITRSLEPEDFDEIRLS